MKTSVDYYFPFSSYAETKTSKAGKKYLSISVCQRTKDKDGNVVKTYFNMVDKRDLLILGNLCFDMYKSICFAEQQERFANSPKKEQDVEQKAEKVDEPFDDEVPF